MASGGENRLKSYKTKGLDVEELRKRREDEEFVLRKSKREEQLSKRRNLQSVEEDQESLSEGETPSIFPRGTPVSVLLSSLHSSDVGQQLAATRSFRRMLSGFEGNPPIQEVIATGCLPKFVEYLSSSDHMLQFEAAWVITNISSGTTLHTRAVVEAGTIPPLIQLLEAPQHFIKEQAVWALGNVAGDSPEYRDLTIRYGIMDPLVALFAEANLSPRILANAAWTLSNICRGRVPPPDMDTVNKATPVLAKMLFYDDVEVLSSICWSVAFLANGPNSRIQKVIDSGLCRRVVELLMTSEVKVVAPALRAVGNMLTGDDVQTQVLMNCSVLPALQHLLEHSSESLQKEACWAVSNITAGNRVQIQEVIECNIFPRLLDIITSGAEYKIRKEAAWAVLNATSGGTAAQIRYLVNIGCIKPLCDMLTVQDPKVVLVTLEGLDNILRVGKNDAAPDKSNSFAFLVEEAYGLDKIEHLQQHSSEQIYQVAAKIIDKYFSEEEEIPDSTVDPEKSADGAQFVFNSNSNAPQGGFNF